MPLGEVGKNASKYICSTVEAHNLENFGISGQTIIAGLLIHLSDLQIYKIRKA